MTYLSEAFNTVSLEDAFMAGLDDALNLKPGAALPWWPKLNHQLFGLRPYEFTLLCAPTGSGKTELLANIATQLAVQSIPQLVAPVEIGERKFALRVAGALSGRKLANGEPVPLSVAENVTTNHLGTFKKSKCFLTTYDNRVHVDDMCNLLEYHVQENQVRVAMLDNLNFFLQPTSSSDQLLEMDRAIHTFVMQCKKLPLHTILVVHPKKTDGGRVESEFDIKGSSTAVQEASNVILFNRPDLKSVQSGERSWQDREVVFKKLRERGEHVNRPVWMTLSNGRYLEID